MDLTNFRQFYLQVPKLGEVFHFCDYDRPNTTETFLMCVPEEKLCSCEGCYFKDLWDDAEEQCTLVRYCSSCRREEASEEWRQGEVNDNVIFIDIPNMQGIEMRIGDTFKFGNKTLVTIGAKENNGHENCHLCYGKEFHTPICDLLPCCQYSFVFQDLSKMPILEEGMNIVKNELAIRVVKRPMITKEKFVELCGMIEKQEKKDHEFADFMENYLDGRFIPVMNETNNLVIEQLMNAVFHDSENDEYGYTWWSWFVYECDLGKKPMEARFGRKTFVVDSPEVFYDFMVLWLEWEPEVKKA